MTEQCPWLIRFLFRVFMMTIWTTKTKAKSLGLPVTVTNYCPGVEANFGGTTCTSTLSCLVTSLLFPLKSSVQLSQRFLIFTLD